MKPRLLVVDDETGIQDMIRGHFELRGFQVLTAGDGAEGIRLAGETFPQVVLLDLKMKQMDGDKAITEIRSLLPSSKIFVVSAYQDELVQKRMLSLGADAYFEKPVSIIELERHIRTALASSVAAPAPTPVPLNS